MKIISLMLIAVIVLLTSFPAPIKVANGRGVVGGGSSSVPGLGGTTGGYKGGDWGVGSGYMGGKDTGTSGGGGVREGGGGGEGYRGGTERGKGYRGGGDPGAAIVVIPKKPPADTKKPVPMPMPQACKQEVRDCINTHIYEGAGEPKHGGSCCEKLKNSVPCVCKFLTSQDPKLSNAANGVLRGCHYRKPNCPKMPMPQECRQDVRHCINTHIYGSAGEPKHRGACCEKLKHSKKCVCKFLTSQDPNRSKAANGVLRGCHFRKPNCPKI